MGARGFPRMTRGNPARITTKMREAYNLNRYGAFSQREIAKMYGVALASVQEWIARVKDEENRGKI
jgi:transposase